MASPPSHKNSRHQLSISELLRDALLASNDSPLNQLIEQVAASKMSRSRFPLSIRSLDSDKSVPPFFTDREYDHGLQNFMDSIGVRINVAVENSSSAGLTLGSIDFAPLHERLADMCLILPWLFQDVAKQMNLEVDWDRTRVEIAWILLFMHLLNRHPNSLHYARSTVRGYLELLRDRTCGGIICAAFVGSCPEEEFEEWTSFYHYTSRFSMPALLYAGFDRRASPADGFRMKEAMTIAALGVAPFSVAGAFRYGGYSGKFKARMMKLFAWADHPGRRTLFIKACERVGVSSPQPIQSTLEVDSRISNIVSEMRKLRRERANVHDPIEALPRHCLCAWIDRDSTYDSHPFNMHANSVDSDENSRKSDIFTERKQPVRLIRPVTVALSNIGLAARNLFVLNQRVLEHECESSSLGIPHRLSVALRKRHHDISLDEFPEQSIGLALGLVDSDDFTASTISKHQKHAVRKLIDPGWSESLIRFERKIEGSILTKGDYQVTISGLKKTTVDTLVEYFQKHGDEATIQFAEFKRLLSSPEQNRYNIDSKTGWISLFDKDKVIMSKMLISVKGKKGTKKLNGKLQVIKPA